MLLKFGNLRFKVRKRTIARGRQVVIQEKGKMISLGNPFPLPVSGRKERFREIVLDWGNRTRLLPKFRNLRYQSQEKGPLLGVGRWFFQEKGVG